MMVKTFFNFWERGFSLRDDLFRNALRWLLVALLSLNFGALFAQSNLITLNENDRPVHAVLEAIKEQTSYVFLYNSKLVDVERRVSIQVKNQTIEPVLAQLFKDSKTSYSLVNNQIVLKNKDYEGHNASDEKISIRGTIKDPSGETIPGVSIVVKGSTKGTISDIDGDYALSDIQPSDVLVFSFIGMQTQEVIVGNDNTINLTMRQKAIGLEEVVAVGYGLQKKKVVMGAISSIDAEEIASRPIMNAAEALQGRLAGVQVVTASGQPGSGINVIVRGVGTNGNNSPLYIVDGVQMENIGYLNPQDIASIDVLKDAASAAIYGARAANGVVIVTTKKGTEGKLNINYDGYVGIQTAHSKVGVLDAYEYMTLHNEGYDNDGKPELKYPETDFENPRAVTNWQNEVFKSAPINNHSLSLSGGNESSTFSTNVGYFGQKGIIAPDKSKFDRITFGLNSEHKLSEKIKIGQTLRYATTNAGAIQEGSNEGILREMLVADPLTPVYETDPTKIADNEKMNPAPTKAPDGRYYGLTYKGYGCYNPLALLENTYNENSRQSMIGSAYIDYNIIDNLKFNSRFGFNTENIRNRNYTPKYYYSPAYNTATTSVRENQSTAYGWQWENTLNYSTSIGNSNFAALVGNTLLRSQIYGLVGARNNLQITGWDYAYVGNGLNDDTQKSNSTRSEEALASFFGKLNYNYNEKYLASFIYRYDGSSRFGQNNKFGNFFSVQLGWNMYDEDFVKNNDIISNMKLRAGYGQAGNDKVGDFQYLSRIGTSYPYPIGADNKVVTGMATIGMANPNLKWESSNELNVGLDIGVFDNRLLLVVDFYSRTTSGLLGRLPVPDYVGLSSPIANLGDVRNSGVEFAITHRRTKGDFYYSITTNATYNVNEVTKIDNDEGLILGEDFIERSIGSIAMKEGQPLPFIYGFKTNGIFQNQQEINAYTKNEQLIQPDALPGDIRFVDTNNDGKISTKDRTNIGSGVPDWTAGLNAEFRYKNFGMTMFWQGQLGCEMVNSTVDLTNIDVYNLSTRFLDRWTGENSTNSFPRMTHTDPNGNWKYINDMVHVENASYLRLKSLNFSYDLEEKIVHRLGISRLRIYIQSNNLLTFTNYSGFDPEIGGNIMSRGKDIGSFPQPRSLNLGVNLTF